MRTHRAFLLGAGVVAGTIVELAFATELVRHGFVNGEVNANYLTLTLAIVVATLVVGAAVGRRVPASAVGPLLVAAALGAALGYCKFSLHPVVAVTGFLCASATALLPLHAGVAHGGGVSRRTHIALGGAHVTLALLGVAMVCTAAPGRLDRWFIAASQGKFSDNPLLVRATPAVARASQAAWWAVLLATAALALAARWFRWRASPSSARRREALVLAGTAAWLLALLGAGGTMFFARVDGARQIIADFSAVTLPVLGLGLVAATIGWVELVRPRLGRVNEGTVELSRVQPADTSALRSLLSDVLATPNVDVVYARGVDWVDGLGRPYALDADARAVTFVRRGGDPIAALLHDADVPMEAIELGARLTAAQLQAQRAAALARARADAVQAATGRLVRAGDHASIEVATALTAGPLIMLTGLAHGLRNGECRFADAATTLRVATADVRRLSHGLFPRELEDHSLAEAVANAGAPARRLHPAVEMTCYLLAHDDEQATFDDTGDLVAVRRSRPLTQEMIERVEVLGGTVDGTVARVPADQL